MRHILIRIEELETLTDRELDELEARLRCILQNCPDLTDTERDNLTTSLANVILLKGLRCRVALGPML